MEKLTIKVSQKEVFDEVAKAAEYIGSNMVTESGNMRERIMITDEALEDLKRFWDEGVVAVNDGLKEMIISGGTAQLFPEIDVITDEGIERAGVAVTPDNPGLVKTIPVYRCELEVADAWNYKLEKSVADAITHFFIAWILAQWFRIVNREEVQSYMTEAAQMLETARRLLSRRVRPVRPND